MTNYSNIEKRIQPRKLHTISKLKFNLLFLLSLCFIALAAATSILWPSYYKNILADELKVTPDSETYRVWRDNLIPNYIEFYFFNWTNMDTLEEEGEAYIPQFQELGPYRFNEKITWVNINWNNNNTMTYEQVKQWFFDSANSNGTLDDEITTLNTVALTAAFTIRDWNMLMRGPASGAISLTNPKIHVVRMVRELLFDGYSDPLLTLAKSFPLFSNVKVPFDKFAWFYKRNGTSFMDGVFNMNTGADDISHKGKLENWNYKNSTTFYDGECANVVGTTGQLFPPGQTRDDKVTMFSPDLCRSIAFDYEEDTEVEGVSGYRYIGGLSMLDNGTALTSNECFCNGECVPSGVLNVTECRFGAPVFASFPHFYIAEPYFLSNVRGLNPIKEKHQFYVVLEPTTGITLDIAARLQVNMFLQPLPGLRIFEKVPTVFFPMMWFQQRVTITASLAWSVKLLLFLQYLGLVVSVVSACCGCLLLSYLLVLCIRNHKAHTMQLKNQDDYNMYVAAMNSPKGERTAAQKYLEMRPKSAMSSGKL